MRTTINKLTKKEILSRIGGLSAPSKMPCNSYSIPARRCKVGAKLRLNPKSVCSVCYALKGRYNFSNVQDAQERRYQTISNESWVDDMTLAIKTVEKSGYFRWHDSGDIQNLGHLRKIVQIAINLPWVNFWLPTREYSIVRKYLKIYSTFPRNLNVRLSGLFLDGKGPVELAKKLGITVSSADTKNITCKSFEQEGKCLDCRACWDKNTFNVTYKKH